MASPRDVSDENDIPLQGTHPSEEQVDDPVTTSVRGQSPPEPTPDAERLQDETGDADGRHEDAAPGEAPDGEEGVAPEKTHGEAPSDLGDYQLSRDEASGRHRIRVRPPEDESPSPGGGFKEISRHSSPEDTSEALEGQLDDDQRFIVLENTETGEKRMGQEGALGNSWMSEGRYDQATIFESEDEAAAYTDE